LAQIVSAAVLWRPVFGAHGRVDRPSLHDLTLMLRRALPFAASGIVANLQTRIGPLMLGYLSSPSELGLFAAASRVGRVARLAPQAMFAGALPVLSHEFDRDRAEAHRVFRTFDRGLMALAVASAAGCALLAAPLVGAIYGTSFANAAPALVWVGVGLIPALSNSARKIFLYAAGGETVVLRWSVAALVVQPGVEFDHHKVIDYAPAKARELSLRIEREPGLVYEAHSTDYQSAAALAALVHDHFAILKVGPAATFALREALWALVDIECELGAAPASTLKQVVLGTMRRDPRYWKLYYTNPATETFHLQYSLSDRVRYYWSFPKVQESCGALLANLKSRGIPLTLLSQYLPRQYAAVRAGTLTNDPRELVLDVVAQVLNGYTKACRPAAGARTSASVGSQ
jgi:hypothetical protein